jgi:hypothetical protein
MAVEKATPKVDTVLKSSPSSSLKQAQWGARSTSLKSLGAITTTLSPTATLLTNEPADLTTPLYSKAQVPFMVSVLPLRT